MHARLVSAGLNPSASLPDHVDDLMGMVTRLRDAERELSAYRRSLHERLDAATGELISRYRDEPALALKALPLRKRSA